MISAAHLVKNFGRFRALNDVTFDVGPAEAVALWGANGAGKTTALRCVLGLLRHRGHVVIDGHDAGRSPRRARRLLGYVPQELAFHDDMRVRETADFYARLRRADRDRVRESLEMVELAPHQRKRVRELSGGMKQRLALALALLADPPALLLDEPTSNLDAAARSAFISLLRTLRSQGKTILFTSHRIDEIESLADRVVVLRRGVKVAECRPSELVETVSLRCTIEIRIPQERLDEAVRVLRDLGHTARRNGVAVYVDAPADRKAAPVLALGAAGLPVHNIEFIAHDDARAAPIEEHAHA